MKLSDQTDTFIECIQTIDLKDYEYKSVRFLVDKYTPEQLQAFIDEMSAFHKKYFLFQSKKQKFVQTLYYDYYDIIRCAIYVDRKVFGLIDYISNRNITCKDGYTICVDKSYLIRMEELSKTCNRHTLMVWQSFFNSIENKENCFDKIITDLDKFV